MALFIQNVFLLKLTVGVQLHEPYCLTGPITSIAVTTAGDVISGSQDSSVRLWILASGESSGVLQGHSKPVLCLDVTTDAKHVISGSEDKTIKIWDIKSRGCATLKGHSGIVNKSCEYLVEVLRRRLSHSFVFVYIWGQ